eukprot:TRINITY_DN4331_c0_g1_i3.p1 TRINITY_DN4331_c0_g1~~TRINITY_DN4331_c0_g1_i3.p1  ORF type:complete len:154 (+),score=18.38 TRINITY_DN4331_c0_g1_i3:327-788(+)
MTFHGPGQLVGYPIFKVADHGGARCYVHKLEQCLIDTCAAFDVKAGRSPDTGVWVGDGKVGAIGVQVSHGVAYHGFALNCNTDLSWFNHIVPCGIVDKSVTSLSKETDTSITIDQGLEAVQPTFSSVFDRPLELVDVSDVELDRIETEISPQS